MKFITEDILREQYKRVPFSSYQLEEGARLTPGAIQFLADRGMNMFADGTVMDMRNGTPITKKIQENRERQSHNTEKSLLSAKINRLYAQFLFTGNALVTDNPKVGCQILEMAIRVEELNGLEVDGRLRELDFTPCTGMTLEDKEEDMDQCFPVGVPHVQLDNGREIALLNLLRSQLIETARDIGQDKCPLCQQIDKRLWHIGNLISQMICYGVGGEECQRKG